MRYNIHSADTFTKELKQLSKRYPSIIKDVRILSAQLLSNPLLGESLGGGLRKIRMAITSKGKGKSGGARVITYTAVVSVEETDITFLTIYDKADISTLSDSKLKELLKKNGLK